MDYYNYGLPQFPNTMIAPQYAQQQVNPYPFQYQQNNCQCDIYEGGMNYEFRNTI